MDDDSRAAVPRGGGGLTMASESRESPRKLPWRRPRVRKMEIDFTESSGGKMSPADNVWEGQQGDPRIGYRLPRSGEATGP